jgi:hypothetical protein
MPAINNHSDLIKVLNFFLNLASLGEMIIWQYGWPVLAA